MARILSCAIPAFLLIYTGVTLALDIAMKRYGR
jgi:hypothetical protein